MLEIGIAEHRHPPALEIGQKYRLVDVALRIEVAEADDFGDAMRIIGKLRQGLLGRSAGWSFTEFSLICT